MTRNNAAPAAGDRRAQRPTAAPEGNVEEVLNRSDEQRAFIDYLIERPLQNV
ncbi:MAG: hypothetical protein IPK60_21045 [Sandaracinaceae bacterium]|nr:hypothetical protein [Sandaracinaceae bacterium]